MIGAEALGHIAPGFLLKRGNFEGKFFFGPELQKHWLWPDDLGVGWHVLGEFYLGPETQVYGGDGYRQFRLGAHVTSMKTGDTEWSAAAGWSFDTDRQSSPYVRLNLMQRISN